jgi:hypothetical protein
MLADDLADIIGVDPKLEYGGFLTLDLIDLHRFRLVHQGLGHEFYQFFFHDASP